VTADGAEVFVADCFLLDVEFEFSTLLDLVTLFEEAETLFSGEHVAWLSELTFV
jgi:hypothetical protein